MATTSTPISVPVKFSPDVNHWPVFALYSSKSQKQLDAIAKFKSLLSKKTPPIDECIELDVLPRIVELLSNRDHPDIQYEAASVLSRIAAGTAVQAQNVVDAGAIEACVQLLMKAKRVDDVLDQVLWILKNIAKQSSAYRDLVLNANVLRPLSKLLDECYNMKFLRTGARTLAILCSNSPAPNFERIRVCLPALKYLFYVSDEEVLIHTCKTVRNLINGEDFRVSALIEAGICDRLIELLGYRKCNSVNLCALQAIGNIVSGTDAQIDDFLHRRNIFPAIYILLSSEDDDIVRETLWVISNIAAGTENHIQHIIDANIFPVIIKVMKRASLEAKKRALWIFTNAVSGANLAQIDQLAEYGCIQFMCELLDVDSLSTLKYALVGIEYILEAGAKSEKRANPYAELLMEIKGYDKISALRKHKDNEIAECAHVLVRTYFKINLNFINDF